MKNKRILAFLLALIMCVTAGSILETAAASKHELEQKIEQIESEINANKNKLNELKNKKAKQKEYLATLEKQIDSVESKATYLQNQVNEMDKEITKLDKQIKTLTSEIKETRAQIKKAQGDIVNMETTIDNTKTHLEEQLLASYMKGSESTLEILMGADSLASFLTRLEMMKRTSEETKNNIDSFNSTLITLRDTKSQLQKDEVSLKEKVSTRKENRESLVTKRAEYKVKQKEYRASVKDLEAQYSEINTYVKELDKSSATYTSYISNLEKEKKAADAEIDRILKEYYAQQGGSSSSGSAGPSYGTNASWAWPLGNASCYISSHYGYRSASISGWSFHGGTDIAGGGIHGKPVYATRAGKVISAVTSNSGYGIYVLIDHGDGYSSLYAHMSARYVNSGDSVKKGQMIGRVGSTGNSTGPHLHFEIRYYGEKKNPMNYVKK